MGLWWHFSQIKRERTLGFSSFLGLDAPLTPPRPTALLTSVSDPPRTPGGRGGVLVSYDDGLAGFDHVELRQAVQDLSQRLLAQRGLVPSPATATLFLALLAARRLPTCGGKEHNVTGFSY